MLHNDYIKEHRTSSTSKHNKSTKTISSTKENASLINLYTNGPHMDLHNLMEIKKNHYAKRSLYKLTNKYFETRKM